MHPGGHAPREDPPEHVGARTVPDLSRLVNRWGQLVIRGYHRERQAGAVGQLLLLSGRRPQAEAQVALDISGRPYFVWGGGFNREKIGDLPTELVPHFFRSLAEALGAALHVVVRGENTHHMIEACFKGVGRSLRQAIRLEGNELPTTKGVL